MLTTNKSADKYNPGKASVKPLDWAKYPLEKGYKL